MAVPRSGREQPESCVMVSIDKLSSHLPIIRSRSSRKTGGAVVCERHSAWLRRTLARSRSERIDSKSIGWKWCIWAQATLSNVFSVALIFTSESEMICIHVAKIINRRVQKKLLLGIKLFNLTLTTTPSSHIWTPIRHKVKICPVRHLGSSPIFGGLFSFF